MNRFTLRLISWKKQIIDARNIISPKVELFIDKYQLIKVGCVFGVGITLLYYSNQCVFYV